MNGWEALVIIAKLFLTAWLAFLVLIVLVFLWMEWNSRNN